MKNYRKKITVVEMLVGIPLKPSFGFRCVFKQDWAAPFARNDDVEVSVAVNIHDRDTQARADAFAA